MLKYYKKLFALKTAPLLVALGIHKILKPVYGGKGHVIMLHRVLPRDSRKRIHNHLSLEVTPDHLEEIIRYFIKEKYHLISIEKVESYLNKNQKFVVFTLDDGYADNLHHAYPVFKKYNCPFTIYLCNDFANRKVFLWWYLLEELLLKERFLKIKTSSFKVEEKVGTLLKKEKVFYRIRDAINLGKLEPEAFKEVLTQYGINWQEHINKYALSWNDVLELNKDQLVTIGAHTVSHRALKVLSDQEANEEMTNSKKEIEEKLGQTTKHFAYPFGSSEEVSVRDIRIAQKVGFETVTTTQLGNIFTDHRANLHSLPRITVNAQTSKCVLKLQLAGFYGMLENKFKRVRVGVWS
ncbi:hypothetical protein E9993_08835 [Labilibacter sediminis]|nr:hypothetical protein E9993_08835 [Labilibacter sediminis]